LNTDTNPRKKRIMSNNVKVFTHDLHDIRDGRVEADVESWLDENTDGDDTVLISQAWNEYNLVLITTIIVRTPE